MHELGARRIGSGADQTPADRLPLSLEQSSGSPVAPPLPSRDRRRSTFARWFDSWMRSLGMAVLLFFLLKTFLVEAFTIPSGSMERTLLAGDFLFVNKAVFGAQIPGTRARLPAFESPRHGDVIVFAYPKNPELNYVKRVIGAPGDTVDMRAGRVRVNGRLLTESYVRRADPTRDITDPEFSWQRRFFIGDPDDALRLRPTRDNWGPLLVPAGKYFVLGDNRDNSADSRYWGFVDATAVKGRPMVVYFSYDREAHDALPWLTDIRWDRLGSIVR